jgi:integral membrane protein
MNQKIRRLRLLAYAEGASLLVLVLIAMPLKHFAHVPSATRVVGLLHGIAFLAYVAAVFDSYGARRLTGRDVSLAILAAIIPGGTFVFARRLPH